MVGFCPWPGRFFWLSPTSSFLRARYKVAMDTPMALDTATANIPTFIMPRSLCFHPVVKPGAMVSKILAEELN